MQAEHCHYCNASGRHARMTWDHIVPKARGGKDNFWNRVRACEKCNQAKGCEMPTCHCPKCSEAVERHPDAWLGPIDQKPRQIVRFEADRCPDCGDPTLTPLKCPWCRNTGIQQAPKSVPHLRWTALVDSRAA